MLNRNYRVEKAEELQSFYFYSFSFVSIIQTHNINKIPFSLTTTRNMFKSFKID